MSTGWIAVRAIACLLIVVDRGRARQDGRTSGFSTRASRLSTRPSDPDHESCQASAVNVSRRASFPHFGHGGVGRRGPNSSSQMGGGHRNCRFRKTGMVRRSGARRQRRVRVRFHAPMPDRFAESSQPAARRRRAARRGTRRQGRGSALRPGTSSHPSRAGRYCRYQATVARITSLNAGSR